MHIWTHEGETECEETEVEIKKSIYVDRARRETFFECIIDHQLKRNIERETKNTF